MKGVIRNNRNYSDGVPAFEIDVYLDDENEFPLKVDERVPVKLKIVSEEFVAGIRYTENAGAWMSPDTYNNRNEKIRLSEILLKHGFKKNESIKLEYDKTRNEITIKKI